MKNSSKYKENPRRVELINLSVDMRLLRNEGVANAKTEEEALFWSSLRINDLIMLQYQKRAGTEDFRTFSSWHEAGFKIKRGEKGWIIWGQKRSAPVPGQSVGSGLAPDHSLFANHSPQVDEMTAEYKFFPTCYLFNENQVEPINNQCHEENS